MFCMTHLNTLVICHCELWTDIIGAVKSPHLPPSSINLKYRVRTPFSLTLLPEACSLIPHQSFPDIRGSHSRFHSKMIRHYLESFAYITNLFDKVHIA